MHPPLPIPSPPAFEVSSPAQAGKAEPSQQQEEEGRVLHAVESQNSGTQAESAAAAQRALPDDDDFGEDEVCSLHALAFMLYTATLQTKQLGRLREKVYLVLQEEEGEGESEGPAPAEQELEQEEEEEQQQAAAAGTALPSDDDDFEEEEEDAVS